MPQTMGVKIWQQCLPAPRDQSYFLAEADQQLMALAGLQSSERPWADGEGALLKPILLLQPLHLRHISDFA